MNVTQQLKNPFSFRAPLAMAPPASPRPKMLIARLHGASEAAAFIDRLALPNEVPVSASQLGWQVPSAARIECKLSGVGDADWSLDADEMTL